MRGRVALLTMVVLVLGPSLAGCGRRNQPIPPPGAEITYPRQYPYEPQARSPSAPPLPSPYEPPEQFPDPMRPSPYEPPP